MYPPADMLRLLSLLVLLSPVISQAQTCQTTNILATTPTAQFTDNADGTVTDTKTGLMWKRCSEGQTFAGNTCTGTALRFTWQNALQQAQIINGGSGFAGKTDWRVPNIKELRSITEKQCFDPAINLTVFPATPSSVFWSSSPLADDGSNARYVHFEFGFVNGDNKSLGLNQVRLVRSEL